MFSIVKQIGVSVVVSVTTIVIVTAIVDPDGFAKMKSRWTK